MICSGGGGTEAKADIDERVVHKLVPGCHSKVTLNVESRAGETFCEKTWYYIANVPMTTRKRVVLPSWRT
jgi:hypothetical protein